MVSSEANKFIISFSIPDKEYRRFELLLESYPNMNTNIRINDSLIMADRANTGKKWQISSWDLEKFRGEFITISGRVEIPDDFNSMIKPKLKAYLLVDQKVSVTESETLENYPLYIMQGFRRSTKLLMDVDIHSLN